MAAGGPNKDSNGEVLRTHVDKEFESVDTSGPMPTYSKQLNRADRRLLARKGRRKR